MAQSASAILDMIAPQFASDPNKAEFITLATNRTNENYYGTTNFSLAVAYLAAHMMTLADTNREAGSVTSKREGDLSISFAAVQDKSGGALSLTKYGRQLQQLRKESGAAIGALGGYDVGY